MMTANTINKDRVIGLTGAGGMIGSHLLTMLLATNSRVRVRCLVRHPRLHQRNDRVEYHSGDLLSEVDCQEFVRGLDSIVHLAQSSTPATSDKHWPSDLAGNMMLSLHLLDAIRRGNPGCHLVYASSGGAIYGHHPAVQLYHEELPCHPLSPYGIQKLAVEHYLRLGVEQGWLSCVSLRIANAYGALLPAERRQGLIGVAVSRHAAGEPVEVFGSPETVRDYLHIDDLADAVIASISKRNGFQIYNIGSGRGSSVTEILTAIESVSGSAVKTTQSDFGSRQFALTPRVVLSIDKALAELSWKPRVALEDGIARMWTFALSQPPSTS